MKNMWLIVIGFLVVVGVFVVFQMSNSNSDLGSPNPGSNAEAAVTIHMTKEGFSPQEVTIKKGETVEWVNDDTNPKWPASDLHPTHEIYPEFDPRQPIAPGDSWKFTFDRVGTWGFHDHNRFVDRGVVKVEE